MDWIKINKSKWILFPIFTALHLLGGICQAQQVFEDCEAWLRNDTMVIRNSRIEYTLLWNHGDILHHGIQDQKSGILTAFEGVEPAFALPSAPFKTNKSLNMAVVEKSIYSPAHLAVEILNEHEGLLIKRILRIFPETPAVTFESELKYKTLIPAKAKAAIQTDGTEDFITKSQNGKEAFLEKFGLPFPHWRFNVVRFKDVTDLNDNLIAEQEIMPYGASQKMKGNLLLANDLVNGGSFFILKEAPNAESQINYPGHDFALNKKEIAVPFSGFPIDVTADTWVKGYPMTIGVGSKENPLEWVLREYLKNSINYDKVMYEMVMMNTWGDRGQDGKINEDFILRELDRANELNISHFQIDDGWQQGLSKNSASSEGALWDDWLPEDWLPHQDRFPNGLEKVVHKAQELGIRLGLWFNPATANDFEAWEQDANTIISLFQNTGIQYFKIDGVHIPTKLAEENLRQFLHKIKEETQNHVFFNLDLTAGMRGGYFLTRYTGNLFLENRYTDWGNYYPYRTLRNVWMLSKYFPPELLQVEFLNKWRNAEKYPVDDPFVPSQYEFEYVFATAMAGQPLAWFEATGIPDEALEVGETISKYRDIQADFHAGLIFPIGEEPTGSSWTGFHSVNPNKQEGYLLIFRELNEKQEIKFHLPWLQEGTYTFTRILGEGKDFTQEIGPGQEVEFSLYRPNSYQLLKYEVVVP